MQANVLSDLSNIIGVRLREEDEQLNGGMSLLVRYLLEKKLACNWRSLNYGRVVTRICERTFWIMQRVCMYVLSYVQETPTERANVSKFGHKGGANCLCILPKTIYPCKAVLLNDFAI